MTKENRNMHVVKDTKLGNIYSKENKKETDSVDKLLKKGESIVLKREDIDFENKVLLLNGEIMKNHKFSKLPLSEELLNMIEVLIQQNKIIRKRMKQRNKLVFITQKGDTIQKYNNTNAIRKRLTKYALDYNLKNINPHSIRRGYALNLLKKGASVVLISKALSHSDIAVTTKYLYLDTEETLDELRTYL
ncbi:tyrosine-type recombinase/integrase [Carnobacterium maltaromaticum]|uniref:tyrosine-type recombinase/integrase n=1 Tax=Carnobacterium maltaromaticum TaxID=2751 RepID=UPI0039AF57FC